MAKVLIIGIFLLNLGSLNAEDYKAFDEALVRWNELRGLSTIRVYIQEESPDTACLLPVLRRDRINVGSLPSCTDIESAKEINERHREIKFQQWLLQDPQLNDQKNDEAVIEYPLWEDLEIFDLNNFGPGPNGDILMPEPPRTLSVPK